MNIYISKDNEEKLRNYDGSMSGLINRLLDDFFKKQDGVIVLDSTPPAENPFNKLHTDKRSSKISPDLPSAKTEPEFEGAGELACCKNDKRPCKHWHWVFEKSTYVNDRSGREREATL